jgi:RNA polymerase sigma-70 factor (ECF subfamily)
MADEVPRDLLERFVRGEEDAFESLFRRFERDVYRWILRIVRDPSAAEDALVDAFWRAHRAHARFDPTRSFGAWIRRIAVNSALAHLTSARRHAASCEAAVPTHAISSDSEGLREAVQVALTRLPGKLQIVAVLALLEERPYAEIAEALDVPMGTVKSRVFRAIRALREELRRLGVQM